MAYTYLKSFHLNHDGITRIGLSSKSRSMVRDVAEKAKSHAISIAPHEDGVYISSFMIGFHQRRDWPRNSPYRATRICADLYNVAPYATRLEVGARDGKGGNTRPQWIMRRTLEHLAIGIKQRRRGR